MYHTKFHPNQNSADVFARFFSPFVHIPMKDVFQNKPIERQQPILANISETATAYHIAISIPGYTKEDLKISLEDLKLIVAAQIEATEDADKTILQEWKKTSFSKQFMLPRDADKSQINAAYEAGVLALTIQKVEKPQPLTITVQ